MASEFAGVKVSIPGFSLEAFANETHPDEKRTRRDLSVDRMAAEDGVQQLPPTHSRSLSTSERIIREHCQQRLDNIAGQGGAVLGNLRRQVEEALLAVRKPDYSGTLSEAEADLEDVRTRMGFPLQSLIKERWQRLSELTFFKRRRNLFRRAEYITSPTLHYGQLILVISLEMLANAFFFAQGSDQGIIGGAVFAGLFSAVNVAWSYVLGRYAYPYALHGETALAKAFGMAGMGVHLLGAGAINLTIAHYRDQLALTPDGAIVDVFTRMRANPLGLESLDAAMLVAIGVIISVFATLKGLTADDPVPGYGALDRAFRKADDDAKAYRGDILDDTSEILSEAGEEIDALQKETEDAVNNALERIEGFRITRELVEASRENYQRLCANMIARYRSENTIVRSEPPPDYFADPVKLDTAFTVLDLNDLPARPEDLERVLTETKDGAARAKDALRQQAETNRNRVDHMLLTHNERGFEEAKNEAQYTGLGETFEMFNGGGGEEKA